MKIRIILALGTGLRRGDIDTLKIDDIDFENNCIATKSKKTKKSMASRPVSVEIMNLLSKYVNDLDENQEKLFKRKFNYRIWRKICTKSGLASLKFHDLRKYADTPIMPSNVRSNGLLGRKMVYIVRFNKAYSA